MVLTKRLLQRSPECVICTLFKIDPCFAAGEGTEVRLKRLSMALIMVVDDDADVVRTFKSNLTREGYQVVCARDGYTALRSSYCSRPDLVLLDIAMPGMDGIELCRQIRANPATASTPILFVTVSGDIESKVAAFDAGADDYLVKPFALQELNLRVKALLLREESGLYAPKD